MSNELSEQDIADIFKFVEDNIKRLGSVQVIFMNDHPGEVGLSLKLKTLYKEMGWDTSLASSNSKLFFVLYIKQYPEQVIMS